MERTQAVREHGCLGETTSGAQNHDDKDVRKGEQGEGQRMKDRILSRRQATDGEGDGMAH